MNLDEWNAQHGGDEEDFCKPQSNRYQFDYDTTYKVRVTDAKAVKSSFGSRQIELKLEVVNGDEVEGNVTEWVALPKQPETDAKLDKATVAKLTLRRRDDLRTVLAAGDAEHYSVPSDLKGPAWEARAYEVNKRVMHESDKLHLEIEQDGVVSLPHLIDATLFVVKVANKKKPDYPYTNWYAQPKKGVPMHGESATIL